VDVLRALLEKAERGEISALLYVAKEGREPQRIGMTGDYREDPIQVLAVNERIRHVVNDLLDARGASVN
jgi:hypothetical protein